MRRAALLYQLKRHFVVTTDAQHRYRTDPNLPRDLPRTRLDQAWVVDITDICLPQTFGCLAASLDAFSRRCGGWRLSRTIDTALTLAALEHALTARRPAPGRIHHSDRGVQYAGGPSVARLAAVGWGRASAGRRWAIPPTTPRRSVASRRSSARRWT